MPTGYTAKLYDGEQEFTDFVLACARAFGAFVLMRDSAHDAPITLKAITDNSDYHVKSLRTAKAELARVQAMSAEEAATQAHADYLLAAASDEEYVKSHLARRERYENMLAEVQAWEPPSADHAEFKKFMVDQLTQSLDLDTSLKHHRFAVEKTSEEWLADKIARLERAIAYNAEEEQKRIERNEVRVRWVNQLRESLGLDALAPV